MVLFTPSWFRGCANPWPCSMAGQKMLVWLPWRYNNKGIAIKLSYTEVPIKLSSELTIIKHNPMIKYKKLENLSNLRPLYLHFSPIEWTALTPFLINRCQKSSLFHDHNFFPDITDDRQMPWYSPLEKKVTFYAKNLWLKQAERGSVSFMGHEREDTYYWFWLLGLRPPAPTPCVTMDTKYTKAKQTATWYVLSPSQYEQLQR